MARRCGHSANRGAIRRPLLPPLRRRAPRCRLMRSRLRCDRHRRRSGRLERGHSVGAGGPVGGAIGGEAFSEAQGLRGMHCGKQSAAPRRLGGRRGVAATAGPELRRVALWCGDESITASVACARRDGDHPWGPRCRARASGSAAARARTRERGPPYSSHAPRSPSARRAQRAGYEGRSRCRAQRAHTARAGGRSGPRLLAAAAAGRHAAAAGNAGLRTCWHSRRASAAVDLDDGLLPVLAIRRRVRWHGRRSEGWPPSPVAFGVTGSRRAGAGSGTAPGPAKRSRRSCVANAAA